MKKLLFFYSLLFSSLIFCQKKLSDSLAIMKSENSMLFSAFNKEACYPNGVQNEKYKKQDILLITNAYECSSFPVTFNILEVYYDGKKYFIKHKEDSKSVFLFANKKSSFLDIKNYFQRLKSADKDSINSLGKEFSEAYIQRQMQQDYKEIIKSEKSGIGILEAYPTEGLSFTGAEFKVINLSKKTIKYLTFNFYGINAVNDKVGASISRKGIGPVETLMSSIWSFDNVWLTDIIRTLKLVSVNIIYMDGSSKQVSITDNNWVDRDAYNNFIRLSN